METEVAGNIDIFPDGRMTSTAASTYLGLSVQTLAKKRCNGTGPKFVKCGRVFYYREDIDEWLRAARAGSTAESRKVLSSRVVRS